MKARPSYHSNDCSCCVHIHMQYRNSEGFLVKKLYVTNIHAHFTSWTHQKRSQSNTVMWYANSFVLNSSKSTSIPSDGPSCSARHVWNVRNQSLGHTARTLLLGKVVIRWNIITYRNHYSSHYQLICIYMWLYHL